MSKSKRSTRSTSRRTFKQTKLAYAVSTALASTLFGGNALAQGNGGVMEEVVVSGIRGSLERSMDLKREATGVVDAISAEDIGKFPDTNLAESLQRITGVSIDRVNGEGSEVTVRGFGGGNNLVTFNGRQMPSANVAVIGGDQNADFAQGNSRSFDFSNLASEAVSGLEVYKTGRASIPTGGIGATINIKTLRPLDDPGFRASVGVKAVRDESVIDGDDITPEASGLVTWTDDSETFGVSLFASYQERQSASMSATSNYWNIRTFSQFMDPTNGFTDGNTVVSNPPSDPNTLVSVPNDSRWHRSDTTRERTNALVTLQFRPMENLTLTLDSLTAQNSQEEQRNDQTNWFNRPFDYVGFDDNTVVATTVFLQEAIAGAKDTGFEQQLRAVEDTLDSVGFNADWQVSDSLSVNFDAHSSTAESKPDGPGGTSSILVSIGAPVVTQHSLDWRRSGFPVQRIWIDDSVADTRGSFGGTNANGVLDAGDLGTQVARTISSAQTTDLDEAKIDVSWELGLGTLNVGFDSRDVEMQQTRIQTQQTLGDWGITNPGDVPTNLIETYCQACLFEDFKPTAEGASLVSFRANAGDLYAALSPVYAGLGNAVQITNNENNIVEEQIDAFYVQFAMDGELGGRPYDLLLGLRHETTDVTSTSVVVPTTAIVWKSDNDFTSEAAASGSTFTATGEYDNNLPSIDFSLDLTDDLKARASYSKTIARASYGNLFNSQTAGNPPRPTALSGVAGGSIGNPGLEPLESTNYDLSFEYYYGDSSYFSVGAYSKTIENFIGSGITEQNLFGLRDPSSGAAGTRSGEASAQLQAIGATQSDVNLFTMTALIDNSATVTDAVNTFQANQDVNGDLNQTFVDSILALYDVRADSTDPLFTFALTTPINTRTGKIHGFEFAWQHFFGDTGFGFQANYTTVNGDVGIDVGSDPGVDQFALLGLSDSANLSLIYENDLFSARLAYNWRDNYLSQVNRGGDRNPVFVKDYSQLDMNVSYDITDNLQLTFEAINITGENIRQYGRDTSNIWFMQELAPRYLIGARYNFE